MDFSIADGVIFMRVY